MIRSTAVRIAACLVFSLIPPLVSANAALSPNFGNYVAENANQNRVRSETSSFQFKSCCVETNPLNSGASSRIGKVPRSGCASSQKTISESFANDGRSLVDLHRNRLKYYTSPKLDLNSDGLLVWTNTELWRGLTMVQTVTVSTIEQLNEALANATENTTIVLEPGNYGELSINSHYHDYVSLPDVTIVSADPENPAVFTSVQLFGAENLTIDNVVFDYTFQEGDQNWSTPFNISGGSSNITITNSVFDGDKASGMGDAWDGFGIAHGLNVRDASDITVENSEFFDFHRAVVFHETDGIVMANNEVHTMSSDGFNFAEVTDVLIEGNYFHDFEKPDSSVAHMDMVQFWTTSTDEPITDVIIRGNLFDSGDGDPTQSIFMRNEAVDTGVAGKEMYYQNILIEDNVIYNGHIHGIHVGETVGLTVQNNTLLQNEDAGDDGAVSVPTIRLNGDSENVHVKNNIVSQPTVSSNPAHVYEDNLTVQRDDPNAPNYVGNLFVDGLADGLASAESLKIIPGSAAEGYGSSLSAFDPSPATPMGYITTDIQSGMDSLTVKFDASQIFDLNGISDLSGATVEWYFGDEAKAEGPVVEHTFSKGGTYVTQAVVTFPGGKVVTLNKTLDVASPNVLNLDTSNLTDKTDLQNKIILSGEVIEEVDDGRAALNLNGGTVKVETTSDFYNNAEYTFGVSFKLGENFSGSTRLVDFSYSFVVFVEDDKINTGIVVGDETYWIQENVGNLANGEWRDLVITFSSLTGAATVYLDGVALGSVTGLEGEAQIGSEAHDLYFGDRHSGSAKDLYIGNTVFLTGALDGEAVKSLDLESGITPIEDPKQDEPSDPDQPAAEEPSQDDDLTPPAEEDKAELPDDDMNVVRFTEDGAFKSGTDGDDRFIGTDGRDQGRGLTGDDYAILGAGDDSFLGDAGNDFILGGDGNDTIDGGEGNDTVYGGMGDDTIYAEVAYGEGGNDTLRTIGDSDDYLDGGEGDDRITASAGNNQIFGREGNDRLQAGSGNDYIDGGSGNDEIRAGAGDDILLGGAGDDLLVGANGDDFLDGGEGRDSMLGGDGDDTFVFDAEDATIRGDAGYDTLLIRSEIADLDDVYMLGIDAINAEDGELNAIFISHSKIAQADEGPLIVHGDVGDTLVFKDEATILDTVDINGDLFYEVQSTRYGDQQLVYVDTEMSLQDQDGVHIDELFVV